jgi:hypothetical protein
MKRRLSILAATIVSLLGGLTESSKAEILIYRARLTAVSREDDSGVKKGSPMPTGMSLLMAFDLNTDYWEQPEGTNEIYIYEGKISGKTVKSFSVEPSTSRSYTKFGYYAKKSKFFLFYGDFEDSGSMDLGALQLQGGLKKNVTIGGNLGKASIPSDTVATLVRGDGDIFKKFTFSLKFDPKLTGEVNNYLKEEGFQSSEGAGQSEDIQRGMTWLSESYLPENFADEWPFSED